MVRGAGCHEINLRIRRREKNVLDIPFYRSGVYTQNRLVMSVMAMLRQLARLVRAAPGSIERNPTLPIFFKTLLCFL